MLGNFKDFKKTNEGLLMDKDLYDVVGENSDFYKMLPKTTQYKNWCLNIPSNKLGFISHRNDVIKQNGWEIRGKVINGDYENYIVEFEAFNESCGRIWGNTTSLIYSDSKECYNSFYNEVGFKQV